VGVEHPVERLRVAEVADDVDRKLKIIARGAHGFEAAQVGAEQDRPLPRGAQREEVLAAHRIDPEGGEVTAEEEQSIQAALGEA
jgi:hypothetical protein